MYGTVFFMSQRYDTVFFDEILIQLNRMTANFNRPEEVAFTKILLAAIINNGKHSNQIEFPVGKLNSSLIYKVLIQFIWAKSLNRHRIIYEPSWQLH